MAENESLEGKNIAVEKEKIKKIEDAITTAIREEKDKVILYDGKSELIIRIDRKDEGYEIKIGNTLVERLNKDGKPNNKKIEEVLNTYGDKFRIKNLRIINSSNKSTKGKEQDSMQEELEKLAKEGTELRMDREVSESEDMHMMFQRMFGVDCHQMWRVRDKSDSHGFKYIGKNDSGKFEEVKGSTSREGTNPNQKVIFMRKDGKLEEKTVDHMIIKGRFALITDIPDGEVSDRTVTGIAVRGPGERYLAIEGLDSRNNEASNNPEIKENLARARSIYEMEDIAKASELAEKVNSLNWDGKITAEEVELVKKLTKEGMPENGTMSFLNFIHELKELGLNDSQVKTIIDAADSVTEQIEELERNNISDKEEAKEIFKMMSEGAEFKEALEVIEDINNGNRGENGEKVKYAEEDTISDDDDYGPWSKRDPRR